MAAAERGEVIFLRGQDDDSDIWDDTALIEAYDLAVERLKNKMLPDGEDRKPVDVLGNNEDENQKKRKQKNVTPKGKKKNKKAKRAKNNTQKNFEWKVGDECMAVYSEDGIIYDAVISSVDHSRNTCVVEYVGYGNREEHDFEALIPPGREARDDTFHTESEHGSRPMSAASHASSNRVPRPKAPTPPTWPWPEMPAMFPGPSPMPGMMPGMPPFGGFPGFPGFGAPGMPPPPPMMMDEDIVDDKEALYSMLISWYMSGYHTGFYQGLKQGQLKAKQHGPNRSQRRQNMQQGPQYNKQSKG